MQIHISSCQSPILNSSILDFQSSCLSPARKKSIAKCVSHPETRVMDSLSLSLPVSLANFHLTCNENDIQRCTERRVLFDRRWLPLKMMIKIQDTRRWWWVPDDVDWEGMRINCNLHKFSIIRFFSFCDTWACGAHSQSQVLIWAPSGCIEGGASLRPWIASYANHFIGIAHWWLPENIQNLIISIAQHFLNPSHWIAFKPCQPFAAHCIAWNLLNDCLIAF